MLTVKKSEYEHLKARDELLTRLLVSGVENTECWKVAKGIGQAVNLNTRISPKRDFHGIIVQLGMTVRFTDAQSGKNYVGMVAQITHLGIQVETAEGNKFCNGGNFYIHTSMRHNL